MNTSSTVVSTTFSKSARKSAIAIALAFAAAALALAGGPSMHNYSAAGYPVGEAMDFELPSMRTSDVANTPLAQPQTAAADSSFAGADASTAYGSDVPRSGVAHPEQHLAIISVPQLPQRQQSPITRESVRAELIAARDAGTLTQANEAGDTQRVLAAREAFNDEQASSIIAAYQAEYDRQVALQEAEIRLAFEAALLENAVAQAPAITDDAMAEVQIDVIGIQPEAVGE